MKPEDRASRRPLAQIREDLAQDRASYRSSERVRGDLAAAERVAQRTRQDLAWLVADGYEETDAQIDRRGCIMRFEGPNGKVSLTVFRTELEIWIQPRGGRRAEMQTYLRAHGLPAPNPIINADTPEKLDRAMTDHFGALATLRETELAGKFTPSDQLPSGPTTVASRERLTGELIDRARNGK